MSLKTLREKLEKKEISAPELCEYYIGRIKKYDADINSFISVCEESAREQANNAQKLIDRGGGGALCGIPFSIKDNISTKGIRTTCGSKILEDFVPVYNAEVVDRLTDNGAVILGKTNMDEFAMGSESQNSYFGGVHNPYNKEKTPGGSSGGAAASVAAKLCAAALGSDTGGSVCRPAAFCGVSGLKPTYGAVSRYGLISFASSLEQVGVLGQSAEDIGYVLNIIAGHDKKDMTTSPLSGADYLSKIDSELRGIKIGLPIELFDGEIVSDEIKGKVMSAAIFYKNIGCELVRVSLPCLKYAVSAYYLISSAEAASNLARFDGIRFGLRAENRESFNELIRSTRRDGFGDEVKRRIMLGNYALSSGYYDEYYKKAMQLRQKICNEYEEILKSCNAILMPTTANGAIDINKREQNISKGYESDICTVSVNLAGLPVISTPCGYDEAGMPVGMSIVGRKFYEANIIALADRFEKSFKRREAEL